MKETLIQIIPQQPEHYLLPNAHFYQDMFDVEFNTQEFVVPKFQLSFIPNVTKDGIMQGNELLPGNVDLIVDEQTAGLSILFRRTHVVTNDDTKQGLEEISYTWQGEDLKVTLLYVDHETFRGYLSELEEICSMMPPRGIGLRYYGLPPSQLSQFTVIRYLLQLLEKGILPG